ncbi:hypothetical protein [Thermodesulfovibrio yellowstonii]|uniref:Uncharacterized protein n=1 Tax=Thermodesulfovibrio yellowstonii TaxID=28262 RepID=A0A9W6GD00_9BACT|nr:hypothetical protein [Thermodesulfovibrio islandicus]GLI52944.1 hypothetical protein TISLANDTSLP1_06370 [Thermodesulfovibrio islandicus]
MPLTENFIKRISENTGINIDELTTSALLALLREKKRKAMMEKTEIMGRYNVNTLDELEDKIKKGEIAEHPAWEDLIVLENLEDLIARITEDMETIQQTS